jgi:hypothetical protein
VGKQLATEVAPATPELRSRHHPKMGMPITRQPTVL